MLIYEFLDWKYSIPWLYTERKNSQNILFCNTYVEICHRF